MKRIVDCVVFAVIMSAFALFGAAVLIDWASGCGEVYHFPDGTKMVGQCVFFGSEK